MSKLKWQEVLTELGDTLFILIIAAAFIIVLGLVTGYVMYKTEQSSQKPVRIINKILTIVVDVLRSIPFIILMILIIPLTLILTGTIIGRSAAIPALIFSATPFFARIVYNSLKEVPKGINEALISLGAKPLTVMQVTIKESLPSLINGLTITLVTLVGFIASAGAIGAGGLGEFAKREAFSENYPPMLVAIALLLLIVFTIQITGDFISKKIDKR